MVNASNVDGKQFRHNRSGRRDGEELQDEGSSARMNRLEIKEVDYMRFKITHKQKYNQQ
jgi:hypothetical protein